MNKYALRLIKNLRLVGFFIMPAMVFLFFLIKQLTAISSSVLLLYQLIMCIVLVIWLVVDAYSTNKLAYFNSSIMNTSLTQLVFWVYLKMEWLVLTTVWGFVIIMSFVCFLVWYGACDLGHFSILCKICVFFLFLGYRIRCRYLSDNSFKDSLTSENETSLSWNDTMICINNNVHLECISLLLEMDIDIKNKLDFWGLGATQLKLSVKKPQKEAFRVNVEFQKGHMHRAAGSSAKELGESVFQWYKTHPEETVKATAAVVAVVGTVVGVRATHYLETGPVNQSQIQLNEADAAAKLMEAKAKLIVAEADAAARTDEGKAQLIVAKSQGKLNESLASEADARKANLEAQTRLTTLQSKKLEEGTEVSDSHKNVSIKSVDSLKPSGVRSRWFG
jgi:hypothetical protein